MVGWLGSFLIVVGQTMCGQIHTNGWTEKWLGQLLIMFEQLGSLLVLLVNFLIMAGWLDNELIMAGYIIGVAQRLGLEGACLPHGFPCSLVGRRLVWQCVNNAWANNGWTIYE